MSSDTLTKIAEAVPDDTAFPRAVPRRRLGRWTAAAVPAPVGLALGSVESHHARGAERTR
ncbi:hypothetical protein [Streptomyces sp. NPDC004324]